MNERGGLPAAPFLLAACLRLSHCCYRRQAMPTARMRRVNETIREVLGDAIAAELKDPRIGFVTVTAVDTSSDLRTARVYVSVLGDEEERRRSLAGLQSSHGVLQRKIADAMRLKRTPTLTFEYDDSVERGDRITRLLDE
jgi:ribosome-binding factor A